MDSTSLAHQLYNRCNRTARTPCFAEDDWLQFKADHHMEPSQCEAVLVLTIRHLCSVMTDLQLETDRLRELRRPTAQDIHDALLKERARTGPRWTSSSPNSLILILGMFRSMLFSVASASRSVANR
jgi:hypothetical protein